MKSVNAFNLPMSMENVQDLSLGAQAVARKYPKACIVCRSRKVKCDRKFPCSTCKRWNIADCVYPSPIRVSPRAKKDESRGRGKGRTITVEFLQERVRMLELMVLNLGGSIPAEDSTTALSVPLADEITVDEVVDNQYLPDDPPKSKQFDVCEIEKGVGKLLVKDSQSRYLSEGFWVNVDQDDDLDVLVETPDSDASTTANSIFTIQDYNTFPFTPNKVDIPRMHPSPSQMLLYWKIYCERVDPLVKILHKPTIEIILHQNDLESLDRSLTALLFSIYYSAATSMTDEEIFNNMGSDRTELIKNHKSTVEQALVNANILETQEIITLQAFVLYLTCGRCNGEAKSVWTLSGIAMRLAQSMGLHRDGTNFGLPFLEIENRRRLWWQLWYLDVRTSEDHGSEPNAIDLKFDTKLPLNTNDSNILSNSSQIIGESEGMTDVTFCIIRYEIAMANLRTACRHTLVVETLESKERILRECFQNLETKYLRHCHGANSLHWLVDNVTRMLMDKSWFMLYHCPTWIQGEASMSRDLQDRLLVIAVQIIERTQRMEHDPKAKNWSWLSHNYFQWLPRAFILAELCNRDRNGLVDRAWKAIDATFETWSETTANSKNGILLKKLMSKAAARRARIPDDEDWNSFINTNLLWEVESNVQVATLAPYIEGDELLLPRILAMPSTNRSQPLEAPLSQATMMINQYPDLTITDESIYTGDWNHMATDFGAIIQYEGRPKDSQPSIGFSI